MCIRDSISNCDHTHKYTIFQEHQGSFSLFCQFFCLVSDLFRDLRLALGKFQAAAFYICLLYTSALAPLLLVWLGSRMRMVVTAAVSIAVFGSVMTLYTGFNQMDHDKIRLIFSLGGSKKDVLTKVLLPGSLPLLMSTMKVNIGLCLVGVIIGEFLSAKAGLGYLITLSLIHISAFSGFWKENGCNCVSSLT